jgi:hypothetical protein
MAAGGVSVDQNGLVTVVGHTELPQVGPVTEFPIAGPPLEIRNSQGVFPTNLQVDALRLRLDMLPYGVCRLDATGACAASTGTAGTTTPSCALSQFGNALAPAALERVFLDVDGVPASGAQINVLVDRPISGAATLGMLWLGFPTLTPSPFPGIEVWGDPSLATTFFAAPVDESWRLSLASLPSGPATFTIQFVSLFLPQNFCLTAPGCASDPQCQGGAVFDSAASHALLITY